MYTKGENCPSCRSATGNYLPFECPCIAKWMNQTMTVVLGEAEWSGSAILRLLSQYSGVFLKKKTA
jgi:hypothetical protein